MSSHHVKKRIKANKITIAAAGDFFNTIFFYDLKNNQHFKKIFQFKLNNRQYNIRGED